MEIVKKILSIMSDIIYIAIVAILIFFVFNFKIYFIASGSMEPTFKIDELIVVKNDKEESTYEIGDIITFYEDDLGADVTHRIVDKDENGYHTKGDANNVEDLNIVTKEKIVGKVVFNSYLLGYAILNYKYQLFELIIISIIVINILFSKKQVKEGIEDEESD